MRMFYLVVMLLFFLLLQAVLAPRIAIGSIAPDFVLLVVLFHALHRGPIAGALLGFAVGFLQDLGTPQLLGLNALLKCLAGYFVGHAGTKTFRESSLLVAALVIVATFTHDLVYLLIYHWPRVGSGLLRVFTEALPSALYTAVFAFFADQALTYFGQRMVSTRGKER